MTVEPIDSRWLTPNICVIEGLMNEIERNLRSVGAWYYFLAIALNIFIMLVVFGEDPMVGRPINYPEVALPILLFGLTAALVLITAGYGLRKQRWWIYCLIVSMLICFWVPIGTALGLFSINTLVKPETRKLFGQAQAGLIMGYISIVLTVLAIAAIPLITGNDKTQLAISEAQTACRTILLYEKIHAAEHGNFIDAKTPDVLPGIEKGDLQGTYFNHDSYVTETTEERSLIITATANGTDGVIGNIVSKYPSKHHKRDADWSGSLMEKVAEPEH